jgi:ABC-type multidrug transport system ATPase subunit
LTHLWFLYYLLVLYVGVLLVRQLIVALDRRGAIRRGTDASVRIAVSSGIAPVLLALPLVVALYARDGWIMWFGIPTPDQSLIPQLVSLVGYGTAVAFGWLIHRQADLLSVWAKQWPFTLAAAAICTGVCLSIAGLTPAFVPAAPGLTKLAYAASYALAIWCWSFAVLGLATRFMSSGNATVRYVADASYWIYLVHLPIVAAFQVMVGRLPLHWSVKFPLILVASFAVLFLTYRYLVRSTFIGQLLNGRRQPRGESRSSRESHSSPGPGGSREPEEFAQASAEPPASLSGLHKRYGKTIALAGLDLEVRRGELLAVLGPNGAGKSTAISLWLGLLEPDAGTVRLLGGSPLDVESRRHVGVMMQEVGLTPELRVRELIELTASYYPDPMSPQQALELTRTEALADRPYAKLSAGQKRQVQFALAICGRAPLLFLDEPTVGLDVDARETMWRTIRAMVAQGCSIVLTTHYLEEAEALADRVAVLVSGRVIAEGTVAEIRSVVSRRHISCSSDVSLEQVRAWPDVIAVTRETDRLHITAVDAEGVVRRLLAADERVRGLEVRQANLAEAFAELTKEAA